MDDSMLWKPTEAGVKASAMYDFLSRIANTYHLPDKEYQTIHRWSIRNIDAFWGELWDYCNIVHSSPYTRVVDDESKMPGAKWFEGARLNYAENLLRRRDDHPALIFRGEDQVQKTISYRDLFEQVRLTAAGLKRLGITKGDRVAGLMPNMPETVVAMLATTSIGAIWTSTSPDFGTQGVTDRFSQVEPKVIFAVDGYFYKGKTFEIKEKLQEILSEIHSVEHLVLVDYTGHAKAFKSEVVLSWEDITLETGEPLVFEQLPFDHPLFILYSSGTTGKPKSIVHSAGGTLLQHLKELVLHCNIQENQTIFYFTTCGWMMWNWFVSALATGASLLLYDGNPFYPSPDALLRLADELDITFFGTSAKYIASLETEGVVPKNISEFPHLKVIASTGSPLTDTSFQYVYRDWKKDVQLSSIAGGTDIISCFMLGNPILPVYLGEIQCIGLGMDVDCLDEKGNSLLEEQGELVCKQAFPSMPIYFWNDPDGTRYHQAYFTEYPGIWRHGDTIVITKHGGVIIYGRSDATLNPQGVRIGTAEIYNVTENLDEIEDSLVVGKKEEGDEKVVLFVKLNMGYSLDDALVKKIRKAIRTNCTPRHVPAIVKEVPDIPHTINGKKVELAVKNIINGKKVKNKHVLANPESLEFYYDILN